MGGQRLRELVNADWPVQAGLGFGFHLYISGMHFEHVQKLELFS